MAPSPVLDAEQLGHLRHWDNLSRQLPHDWSLMQGKGLGEDDFGSYRFQLAYMVYGLALTHRHRLPAAPGLFRPTIQRLIDKLLLPDVWMYWRDVSRGGSVFNAHLADRLHEEWDPVVRDNIMYSRVRPVLRAAARPPLRRRPVRATGRPHLPALVVLLGRPGEGGSSTTGSSLNEHLYWQMVESGYVGVACEPNCVFQICNQPAILGFRLHDLITGGSRADDVVAGYERTWADFGRLDGARPLRHDGRRGQPRRPRRNEALAPWVDAWCGALMNSWNRDFVHEHYPRQVADVPGPGARRHPVGALRSGHAGHGPAGRHRHLRHRLGGGLGRRDGRPRDPRRDPRPRRPVHAPDVARRRPVLPAQRHPDRSRTGSAPTSSP